MCLCFITTTKFISIISHQRNRTALIDSPFCFLRIFSTKPLIWVYSSHSLPTGGAALLHSGEICSEYTNNSMTLCDITLKQQQKKNIASQSAYKTMNCLFFCFVFFVINHVVERLASTGLFLKSKYKVFAFTV